MVRSSKLPYKSYQFNANRAAALARLDGYLEDVFAGKANQLLSGFAEIPNEMMKIIGIGVSFLLSGGVIIAFAILGDLQEAVFGRKYLFGFSPSITAFMLSYTVIIAGFDFLYAVATGGLSY